MQLAWLTPHGVAEVVLDGRITIVAPADIPRLRARIVSSAYGHTRHGGITLNESQVDAIDRFIKEMT